LSVRSKQIVETGIPTLDLLLGGGIPARQSVVVTGEPGAGKTVLCSQIAFGQVARGRRVVIATVASESQDKLLEELQGFSFYDPDRVGDEIYLVSIYPALQRGPKEAKDLLLKAMRDRKASMLFIDGLRSLRDLWQNEAKLRDFLYEVNVGLAQQGAIGLFTTEYGIEKLMEYPEATTVDGIISLAVRRVGGRVVRRAQVVKLRGRAHLTSDHVMHITSKGIHLVPRIEETTEPGEVFVPTDERADLGIPMLDDMLHGGLPSKSTTLLAGSTGVGKTLLALSFVASGAKKEQPGLLVTYTEPVERLVARAKKVALDVEPLLRSGRLHIEYRSAVNVEADDLVDHLLRRVRDTGARRVVIDGVGDLDHAVLERERLRPVLTSLLVQLRRMGVTSIFAKEMAKIAGPDLDFGDTPISVTAENLIFLRHIEWQGRLLRILSILKMRESGFDPCVRQFEISDRGITLMDPVRMAEGQLTGIARVMQSRGDVAGP
jgi:circadian clock protein KaiC